MCDIYVTRPAGPGGYDVVFPVEGLTRCVFRDLY